MLAATKEETFSALSSPGVLFPLAACEGVGENSRLGFARKTVALRQGTAPSNSRTALRDRGNVAQNTRRMSLLPQTPRFNQKPCTVSVFNPGCKPKCPPLLHDPKAKGIDTVVDAYVRAVHPLDMLVVSELMVFTGATTAVTGGAAVVLGCADPTPFEPLTCAAGATTGVPTAAGGMYLMKQGINFFKDYTIPAFKNWGCIE
jgi:hypothetical protein